MTIYTKFTYFVFIYSCANSITFYLKCVRQGSYGSVILYCFIQGIVFDSRIVIPISIHTNDRTVKISCQYEISL